MFEIDQGTGQPYRGTERRQAFFPRRLRSHDEVPRELQGTDRRSGKDRRKHDGADDPAAGRNCGT